MLEEKVNHLLTKYFRNECTSQEAAELQYLLKNGKSKDALVLRAFDRIQENHNLDHSTHQFDKQGILDGIKGELFELESKSAIVVDMSRGANKSRSIKFLRIAASVCLIALTSWFIYTSMDGMSKEEQLVTVDEWKEFETQRGQTRTISLPDGSEIKLNVSSKVRFQRDFMNGQIRKIYLDGEAFFDVAKMLDKPFVVLAKGVETSVLGTSFNIEAYEGNDNLSVAVVTGKVKVSEAEGKDQIYLEPNEMATWGNNRIEKSGFDHDLILAWTERSLIFKKASFEEVMTELENWYDIDITVKGTISSNEYDGVHDDEPLETLLRGLGFAGDFKYEIEGKKVTITPN
ncbi:MAG: DUF4974 domain-containing protein [Cyclobacteriaceae bacterium]